MDFRACSAQRHGSDGNTVIRAQPLCAHLLVLRTCQKAQQRLCLSVVPRGNFHRSSEYWFCGQTCRRERDVRFASSDASGLLV